jgi:hypothetical protein
MIYAASAGIFESCGDNFSKKKKRFAKSPDYTQ